MDDDDDEDDEDDADQDDEDDDDPQYIKGSIYDTKNKHQPSSVLLRCVLVNFRNGFIKLYVYTCISIFDINLI
jgi:hypothetical protein